ncbi:hypothetical protein ADUPG1_013033 [Aduncisulcus paluster]|uniref:Uncharacterized protein n=1 Tax=Aduncisulcus paluster TaxID=2918883 RepID=A0ABQ5K1I7_9EUKA|nr:hypothetical protein ADUPG1_013033 [Aduncisulcus paluster]
MEIEKGLYTSIVEKITNELLNEQIFRVIQEKHLKSPPTEKKQSQLVELLHASKKYEKHYGSLIEKLDKDFRSSALFDELEAEKRTISIIFSQIERDMDTRRKLIRSVRRRDSERSLQLAAQLSEALGLQGYGISRELGITRDERDKNYLQRRKEVEEITKTYLEKRRKDGEKEVEIVEESDSREG